ncbi:MAG: hypothetical protein RMJ55_00995 [Roseiflexaceae bacterium]|nr:hypothetical protein [Roseiflexus sp.]MCS7290547.1 hypothetical protein [Roseiflexus sp.]MDW8148313.1 hypothetical protein [Roseiflexaceae bacterium]MDW8212107.1 hypothetical protein [Roseiflexaceae bacterium]
MLFGTRVRHSNLDAALERSIARAGMGGVRYTRRQLYYEVCRTLLPQSRVVAAAGRVTAVAGSSLTLALRRPHPLWIGAMSASLLTVVPFLVRRLPFTLTPPLTENAFNEALAVYRANHGDPPGLLPDDVPPSIALNDREPDLYDYGLAYALVCQDATIARMLRANFLHMEMSCAILSLEEASPLPDALVAMLMRGSAPRILLLHDASLEGLRFAAAAATLLDLPRGFRVRALGLTPMHALRRHLFAIRRPEPVDRLPASLNLIERAWLRAGYRAEVAALRPVTLLRTLHRVVRPAQRRESWFSNLRRWRQTGYMSWPE